MRRREFLLGAAALALRRDRIDAAQALIEKAAAGGEVSAAVLHVKQGNFTFARAFGSAGDVDTVFLLASISKPITAAGVMLLADRGLLSLSDPVRKFIPEFTGGDRDLVTVRHLLTHTSGLPDMLPENMELRKRFAPLKEFVSRTVRTPLLFKPGTDLRYQSMGILLAAEIAERITQLRFRDFLRSEVFEPLRMTRSSLGLGGRSIFATAQCQVPGEPWGWNSPYWRDLGSPWGGVHSTAPDIERLLRYFERPDSRVLRPATAREMVTNQTSGFKESYGLGWRLRAGGRACSVRTFGHSGSTGTVCWLEPESTTSFVLLTTKPHAESGPTLLRPVSDLVSEAAQAKA
jgi:CubicO group peptidase (beta-lactamase class C family)